MPVNVRLLRFEIDKQSDEIFKKIKPLLKKEFDDKKQDLLDAFDNHPVTEEINAGPQADSQFVDTAAGGNLYSLIGFEKGESPTDDLREILNQDITLQIQRSRKIVGDNTITWEVPVNIPTLDTIDKDVAKATPLQWTSKAWTNLLEKGIPWFRHYLFDDERSFRGASRSGPAIQIKGNIKSGRDSSFRGIKYISELLNDFKESITGR